MQEVSLQVEFIIYQVKKCEFYLQTEKGIYKQLKKRDRQFVGCAAPARRSAARSLRKGRWSRPAAALRFVGFCNQKEERTCGSCISLASRTKIRKACPPPATVTDWRGRAPGECAGRELTEAEVRQGNPALSRVLVQLLQTPSYWALESLRFQNVQKGLFLLRFTTDLFSPKVFLSSKSHCYLCVPLLS